MSSSLISTPIVCAILHTAWSVDTLMSSGTPQNSNEFFLEYCSKLSRSTLCISLNLVRVYRHVQNHSVREAKDKPEGTRLTTSAAANTVTQGDAVTFTCHVTAAKPQVSQYRFYLNDTTPVKDSKDSQYTISNVQRSQHYGKYKCVPHNDVDDGPEATVTLNVNGE
ncbi:hypothetical protein ACROYT_G028494 [Oculina patagonica]